MDMLRHKEEAGGIAKTLCERCLLGLCISLLGEWRDEEELFFSLLYSILKVDILIMGQKKEDCFQMAPCWKV